MFFARENVEDLQLEAESVGSVEKLNRFSQNIIICCDHLDFLHSSIDHEKKQIKLRALKDILEDLRTQNVALPDRVVQHLFEMIKSNIVRGLPITQEECTALDSKRVISFMTSDALKSEELNVEAAWSHLRLVYKILIRYLKSSGTSSIIALKYVNQHLISLLLQRFDSGHAKLRGSLRKTIYNIYRRFVVYRSFIRKSLKDIFHEFVCDTQKHNGISDLLEVLGAIISGLSEPLKEEYRLLLTSVLIALHKPKCMGMYNEQLAYCITEFLNKDLELAEPVIRGLLRNWPEKSCQRELFFLQELEEILMFTQHVEFSLRVQQLARRLQKCLSSSNYLVAVRALMLWENESFVRLFPESKREIVQILRPVVDQNANCQWHVAVKNLSMNLRNIFVFLGDEDLRR
ncbi:hypothetical protein KP509_1Z192400 [Ceratopteris richardii]|nr:hypothetical protein KP509_1Z192400 [Ceratopteris richardii]